MLQPVRQQVAIIPLLPRGGIVAFDIETGPPFLSSPHRLIIWKDENGVMQVIPEDTVESALSLLSNVPATVSSMAPSAGMHALP